MNRRLDNARIVIDVDKTTHKKLKIMAAEESKSLRTIFLEAIEKILSEKDNKK